LIKIDKIFDLTKASPVFKFSIRIFRISNEADLLSSDKKLNSLPRYLEAKLQSVSAMRWFMDVGRLSWALEESDKEDFKE